jgi:2'-5' RNA ligase
MVQYAIIAFPRSDALAAIETLRTRFDPLASVLGGHVTLVFPFVPVVTAAVIRTHVERVAHSVRPIELTFGGVSVVDDEYLFLDVGLGAELIIALHDALYTGPLATHLSSEHPFRPHLTLGRLRDPGRLPSALITAQASFPRPAHAVIDEVAIFRLDEPGRGEVELTASLNRLSSQDSATLRREHE